mgnify:FL=1
MNIYSVRRDPDEEIDYDSFLGFVCVAATEDEARKMWPSTDWNAIWCDQARCWVDDFGEPAIRPGSTIWNSDLDSLQVEHIGVTSVPDQPSGVVMHSFLAG